MGNSTDDGQTIAQEYPGCGTNTCWHLGQQSCHPQPQLQSWVVHNAGRDSTHGIVSRCIWLATVLRRLDFRVQEELCLVTMATAHPSTPQCLSKEGCREKGLSIQH